MNDVIMTVRDAPASSAPRHEHPQWELFYCTQGAGRFIFDDLELPYQAGDVIVIPAGLPHAHPAAEESGCISLYVTNATLSFRQPMALQDDENQSLLHLFEDAHYLFHHHPEQRESLLPAYGHLIAQHISLRRTASPRNLLVEELAQSIMQSFANPNYDLDGLLRSAPYCYDYLCRLFRQEMKVTPHKYLAHLRLQTAADILRSGTGKSVSEVARMCGYQDPLYFSRMFKKKYAVSPREYARQQPQEEPPASAE